MTETRANASAAPGGPTSDSLPAERSLGATAPARIDAAHDALKLWAWEEVLRGWYTPQVKTNWFRNKRETKGNLTDAEFLDLAEQFYRWRLNYAAVDGRESGAESPGAPSIPKTAAEASQE